MLKARNQSLYKFIFNTNALRKAKIVYNFGLSECNRAMSDKHVESQNQNLQEFVFVC